MRPNIGIINALVRITCGLTFVAWATSKYCKRPWRDSYLIAIVLGSMKVGEGILRYCPITYLFQNANLPFFDEEDGYEEDDEKIVINPT
ncbi:YgaP family membrane protein [Metabacillus sp. Hm71]|uniref:YgaP family membrane protein n=1 Tax=Metabacillus sp. Hm71 TaxID=3450743 RepID=UPI003F44520E